MRVVFCSLAVRSHLFNMVPLAWAFRAAGHEVRVVASPALTDDVTAAGLTAVPVGADVDLADFMTHAGYDVARYVARFGQDELDPDRMSWEDLWGIQTVLTPTFWSLLSPESLVDGLITFCRSWRPDLVVWDPGTFAAPIAAAVTGTPHARILWGPDVLTPARNAFRRCLDEQPPEHRDDPLAEWMASSLRHHGGPDRTFDETMVLGHWTIDPMPPALRLDSGVRTVGMRFVGYNGPAVVPDWVVDEPARPRVCLTLGASSREHGVAQTSVQDLLHAVGEIDAEIVATFDEEQMAGVDTVPDNVRAVSFVPIHALLPTCAAIVHHGGSGTWGNAAIHGVPQVIFPDGWDVEIRATRTEARGAGIALPGSAPTAATVREAVTRVLDDPSYRDGAEQLRRDMLALPSPAEVVTICERLTATAATG